MDSVARISTSVQLVHAYLKCLYTFLRCEAKIEKKKKRKTNFLNCTDLIHNLQYLQFYLISIKTQYRHSMCLRCCAFLLPTISTRVIFPSVRPKKRHLLKIPKSHQYSLMNDQLLKAYSNSQEDKCRNRVLMGDG